jgi:serine/threonine protein kinase
MARACRAAKESIPIGLTLSAVRDTALALHYAHTFTDARGRRQIVIHRDVAEKNIMVTYEGVTKLLDFGIAKALGRSGRTSVGMVKGTSGYMSPEQIRGEPLDARSDIFSLGVVLHECLTGLRLFHGKSPEEGMKAALQGTVPPPSKWNKDVRPELDQLVMKALQRDRDARFTTALEFARAVDKAGAGLIWHPEQVGELVLRYFADRRAETRRLLDEAYGHEATGEIRVQSLIARIKAEPKRSSPSSPSVSPSPAAPQVSAASPTPLQPATSSATTQPSLQPTRETSPARPRVLKTPTSAGVASPVPAPLPTPPLPPPRPLPSDPPVPSAVNLSPRPGFHDDDESDAKTIPAAALPAEIRELRKRLQAEAEARRKAEAAAARPSVEVEDERTVPVQTHTAQVQAKTESAPAMKPVVRRPPNTSTSGQTLSITHRAEPDWNDEDRAAGAQTKVESVRPAPPRSATDDFVPTSSMRSTTGSEEVLLPRRSRTGLIVGVVGVLLVAAVIAGLVLTGVIP